MMEETGVASPLCSYTYITVNGEDWGLYLAVEGIEESFLQRNYGKDYGELYKPDSMSMGGGRGNGKDFDMNSFTGNEDFTKNEATTSDTPMPEEATEEETTAPETTSEENAEETTVAMETQPDEYSEETTTAIPDNGNSDIPQLPDGVTPPDFSGELPDGVTPPDFSDLLLWNTLQLDTNSNTPSVSDSNKNSASPQVSQLSNISFAPPSDSNMPSDFNIPSMGGMGGFDFNLDEEAVRNAFRKLGIDESLLDGIDFENISITDVTSLMSRLDEDTIEKLMQEIIGESFGNMPSFGGDFSGGMSDIFGGMGSSDVKLQYSDNSFDSYSNIFKNAKTDITNADKTRLITALKKLSSGEDLESTVSTEEVIRYFVVHNFVVNGDSYTGSMIHNYYLYEKDGQIQMIPWDYNLAFGGFMSMGGASGTVNDPIDTPLSVTGNGDRPMIDWIFSDEEYTELYHQYFSEFIAKYFDNGYFESLIDNTISMISPYVEKDPTKFCTYEEFIKGSSTLKEFCLLRAESVKGQLNGSIGSTSATQVSDTLIDANNINISDMGSMGSMGGMGNKGGMSFPGSVNEKPQDNSDINTNDNSLSERPSDNKENPKDNPDGASRPQMPDSFQGITPPDFNNGSNIIGSDSKLQNFGGSSPTDFSQSQFREQSIISLSSVVTLVISILLLVFALLFALKYKRRK